MNLTIPIMAGQMANITVIDSKTKETFIYSASHNKVQVFKRGPNGTPSMSMIYVCDVSPKDTLLVKGIGRNKRRSPVSLKISNGDVNHEPK
jgi:hypothetical protein